MGCAFSRVFSGVDCKSGCWTGGGGGVSKVQGGIG